MVSAINEYLEQQIKSPENHALMVEILTTTKKYRSARQDPGTPVEELQDVRDELGEIGVIFSLFRAEVEAQARLAKTRYEEAFDDCIIRTRTTPNINGKTIPADVARAMARKECRELDNVLADAEHTANKVKGLSYELQYLNNSISSRIKLYDSH